MAAATSWATTSSSWPSSMASTSIFPWVDGTRAERSLMRGTATGSPVRRARRTAEATSVS